MLLALHVGESKVLPYATGYALLIEPVTAAETAPAAKDQREAEGRGPKEDSSSNSDNSNNINKFRRIGMSVTNIHEELYEINKDEREGIKASRKCWSRRTVCLV